MFGGTFIVIRQGLAAAAAFREQADDLVDDVKRQRDSSGKYQEIKDAVNAGANISTEGTDSCCR